jgi:hypothetical protein
MRTELHLAVIFCIASVALCMALTAQTMPRATSSPSASPKTAPKALGVASPAKQSTRPVPFHGMISAVDQNAKTFTITGKKESRVFKVTDKTSISKSGKAATMKDITENEEASGSYWKNADGTLEAKTVKLGPMGAGAKKGKSSPAASPITSPEPKP